jgi:hypothetical protein
MTEQEMKVNLLHQLRHMVSHLNQLEVVYRDYELHIDVEEGHGVGNEIDIDEIRNKRDYFIDLLIQEIPKTNLVESFYDECLSPTLKKNWKKEDYYITIETDGYSGRYGGQKGYVIKSNGEVEYNNDLDEYRKQNIKMGQV